MKKVLNPIGAFTIGLADVCRVLPTWALWPISCVVGMVLYWSRRGRRREVTRAFSRLREIAGLTESPELLTRRFFRRQFMLQTAPYILHNASRKRWQKLVRAEGVEPVRQALANGSGVVVATMHFGTLQLFLSLLEQEGRKVAPVRPAHMKQITSIRQRRMLRIHNEVVYVGKTTGLVSPLRHAVRLLQNNYVVGIAYDGDQGERPAETQLFGRAFHIHRGALELARLGRSPIFFALGMIEKHRYVVRYFPMQDVPDREDSREVMDRFFERCMRQYEDMIRLYPECVWWHRPFCELVGLRSKSD